MPYTKEQLRAYWQTHKDHLNQKRREKRRLAKLGLAIPVSHHQPTMANPAIANPKKVSHDQPTSLMANPILTKLIQQWQTATNYNCASTCPYSYCNNCWYFTANQLVNYKGGQHE